MESHVLPFVSVTVAGKLEEESNAVHPAGTLISLEKPSIATLDIKK
jgi:hypothetical protein